MIELIEQLCSQVFDELDNRSGFDDWLGSIDKDIQYEIKDAVKKRMSKVLSNNDGLNLYAVSYFLAHDDYEVKLVYAKSYSEALELAVEDGASKYAAGVDLITFQGKGICYTSE